MRSHGRGLERNALATDTPCQEHASGRLPGPIPRGSHDDMEVVERPSGVHIHGISCLKERSKGLHVLPRHPYSRSPTASRASAFSWQRASPDHASVPWSRRGGRPCPWPCPFVGTPGAAWRADLEVGDRGSPPKRLRTTPRFRTDPVLRKTVSLAGPSATCRPHLVAASSSAVRGSELLWGRVADLRRGASSQPRGIPIQRTSASRSAPSSAPHTAIGW